MDAAVDQFRERMRTANRWFLDARIAEQQQAPQSIDTLARYWFRWDEVHNGWQRFYSPPELQEQARLESDVRTLDDVAALPHFHMDGTQNPCSEEARERYLRVLEEAVNDTADTEKYGLGGERIELPEELGQFLMHTTGAYDPDFRHSGICDLSFITSPDDDDEVLYNYLEECTDVETWPTFITQELDVVTGILINMNGRWSDFWPEYQNDRWYSLYLYCRPAVEEDEELPESEREFGWRVVIYHQKTEYEFDLFSFKTIPEFLEWYSAWEERLDEAKMREAVSRDTPLDSDVGDGGI